MVTSGGRLMMTLNPHEDIMCSFHVVQQQNNYQPAKPWPWWQWTSTCSHNRSQPSVKTQESTTTWGCFVQFMPGQDGGWFIIDWGWFISVKTKLLTVNHLHMRGRSIDVYCHVNYSKFTACLLMKWNLLHVKSSTGCIPQPFPWLPIPYHNIDFQ
jgi:hypothetical protein